MSQNEVWPNLFIVGAAKAGTTSLHEYLKKVPDIYMSDIKEPRYFSISLTDVAVKPIRDKQVYLSLFKKGENMKFRGESSPTYLIDPEAPKLIHEVSPCSSIIISLRDPVEKAYSAYFHNIRDGIIKSSFHDILEQVMEEKKIRPKIKRIFYEGLYYDNVEKYLDIFGKDNVKIIFFEELVKNTTMTMNEIMKFLKLNHSFNDSDFEVHNQYVVSKSKLISNTLRDHKGIKKIIQKIIPFFIRTKINELILVPESKPQMEESDKQKLIKFYSEDVNKLKKLFGKDLPWKNFVIQ